MGSHPSERLPGVEIPTLAKAPQALYRPTSQTGSCPLDSSRVHYHRGNVRVSFALQGGHHRSAPVAFRFPHSILFMDPSLTKKWPNPGKMGGF